MRGTLFWNRALGWGGSGGERHNTIITHISPLCEQKALIPNIDKRSRYSDAGDCSPNLLHYLAFHHTEGRLHLLLGDQVVPFCLDLFPGSFPLFQGLFPIYPHPWRTRRAPSRSGITLERTLSTWSRGTTSWKLRTDNYILIGSVNIQHGL